MSAAEEYRKRMLDAEALRDLAQATRDQAQMDVLEVASELSTLKVSESSLRVELAAMEAKNAKCEEWGKSEARMKERAEVTIERLKYILNRIEMSGQGEMLAQYACDWAERITP